MATPKPLPRRIKVEVTANDIARGEGRHPWRCAVARAVSRVFRQQVSVGSGIVVHETGERFSMPAKAINFICDFDEVPLGGSRRGLKPFTFIAKARV